MNIFPFYNQDFPRKAAPDKCLQETTQKNHDYNKKLLSPYEGFIRGNMFADLYDPYYNTEPYALKPLTERQALLSKYQMFDFACTDLGLYLDNHPDDAEVIQLYVQYRKQAEQWKNEYETRYGPLTQDGENINAYPWTWNMSPWSWEGEQ